jgi:hypothetical protein
VPELALACVTADLGRAEPDPEIQDLIVASPGLNLAVDFLPGALPFDPAPGAPIDAEQAAAIVWLDALLTNVDRTPRNPNLLTWHGRTWLIDHGALLLVHGDGDPHRPFSLVREHVLLPYAGSLAEADARCAEPSARALPAILDGVPDAWLGADPAARRVCLAGLFAARLEPPRPFVAEAEEARRAAA